jgi:methylthioribose-1-phosphate isomerase
MLVEGKNYRTIWDNSQSVFIIDQRWLPHRFVIEEIRTLEDMITAIRDMHLRGAPLIGIAGAYGMWLAAKQFRRTHELMAILSNAAETLIATRPTAINLKWAIDKQFYNASNCNSDSREQLLLESARRMADEDVETCKRIGEFGLEIIRDIYKDKQATINILTHCNAGWLATVDYGTATAPIYAAHKAGIPINVWVDETRPRNQGSKLTAWELLNQGIPHTIIADNAGGHLMQNNMVDIVLVGSDRTTAKGDVCNKIGTYLKALAAHDNNIPFYVALPTSTLDLRDDYETYIIPIEERDGDEVRYVEGLLDGEIVSVLVPPASSPTANPAFDVTPARLVDGLITELGTCKATFEDIRTLLLKRD